jgi:shikimate kinase
MNRRIVIVGFMGCGKTTVGAALAHQLTNKFVDLDSYITEREGRSPAEIIQTDGEAAFREIETLALRDVLADSRTGVIAVGGGAWTVPANRTLAALHDCLSIWLDAPFELCWQRIAAGDTVRPMAPDRATAAARFQDRSSDYASADRRVPVNESDNAETIVAQILGQL